MKTHLVGVLLGAAILFLGACGEQTEAAQPTAEPATPAATPAPTPSAPWSLAVARPARGVSTGSRRCGIPVGSAWPLARAQRSCAA